MTLDAEAALMGLASEQYFQAYKARDLAAKFDALFSVYGKTTALAAQAQRPEHLVLDLSIRPSKQRGVHSC